MSCTSEATLTILPDDDEIVGKSRIVTPVRTKEKDCWSF
jgi:hypothetical protein